MDAVPRLNCKRKQQADDDDASEKPRLQLQTQWLDRPGPLPSPPLDGAATPPYEPTHTAEEIQHTRAKRPRIEQPPHPRIEQAPAASSPVLPPPRRTSSPSTARRADELLSDLQALAGRRWDWVVQNGQTVLVASYRPVSRRHSRNDILRSQSAPTSPVSAPSPPNTAIRSVAIPCASQVPALPTINASTLREVSSSRCARLAHLLTTT